MIQNVAKRDEKYEKEVIRQSENIDNTSNLILE